MAEPQAPRLELLFFAPDCTALGKGERDTNLPAWYAAYMAAEQAGTELPM